MRALQYAISLLAAFAVQVVLGSPYYGNYTSTSTVFVTKGQCVPVTSLIYTTIAAVPSGPLPTADLSESLITKTLFKTATITKTLAGAVETTLTSTATFTSVYTQGPTSDESVTHTTVYRTTTSIVGTTTLTETTTVQPAIGTIYTTLPTTTVTNVISLASPTSVSFSKIDSSSSITASSEISAVTGSNAIAQSDLTSPHLVTEVTVSTKSETVMSEKLTTVTSALYITSTPTPSVIPGKFTTSVSTETITTVYVYTRQLPSPKATDNVTGPVVVVTSVDTVLPEVTGGATGLKDSPSPALESRTIILSTVHTLTKTLAPESTVTPPPETFTSTTVVTSTLEPATTQSAHLVTVTSVKTVLTTATPTSAASSLGSFNKSMPAVSSAFSSKSTDVMNSSSQAVSSFAATTTGAVNSTGLVMTSSLVPSATGLLNSSSQPALSAYSSTLSGTGYNSTSVIQTSHPTSALPVATGSSSAGWGSNYSLSTTVSVVSSSASDSWIFGQTSIPVRTSGYSASAGFLDNSYSIDHATSSANVSSTTMSSVPMTSVVSNITSIMASSSSSANYVVSTVSAAPHVTSIMTQSSGTPINETSTTSDTPAFSSSSAGGYAWGSLSFQLTSTVTTSLYTLSLPVSSSATPSYSSAFSSPTAVGNSSATVSTFANSTVSSSLMSISSITSSPREFPTGTVINGTTIFPGASPWPVPTVSTPTTTATGPNASSTCGEHGDFTLSFDDIPPLTASNNVSVQAEPIFSPYHQFYFSKGFVVVPIPVDPFLPSSGGHLLEFETTNSSSVPSNPVPGGLDLGTTGGIGNGYTDQLGCFNFNAYGASLGCTSQGPPCIFQVTGMKYNNVTKVEDAVTSQQVVTPACPAQKNCNLTPLDFDDTFVDLTSIHINATVNNVPKVWYMDDLRLGWTDNSCDAGLCRQSNV